MSERIAPLLLGLSALSLVSASFTAIGQTPIEIAIRNRIPVASDDLVSVVPGIGPTAIGDVTANDSFGPMSAGTPGNVTLLSSPSGKYGFLIFQSNGNFQYNLLENSPNVLALRQGQVVSDVFQYRYTNELGLSATAKLTVNIIGNPNGVDRVIANDTVATVIQNTSPVISGSVSANDSVNGIPGLPANNRALGNFVTLNASPIGRYGYLTLQADGEYTYQLNENAPEVQALKPRDLVTDIFPYTYLSQGGGSASANLVINIIGNPTDTNDRTVFEDNLYNDVDIEPNNRSSQATPLTSARRIKGHLQHSRDNDWFRLFSAGNEQIRLELCPSGTSCFGKKSWVLYVFDSDALTPQIEFGSIPLFRWVDETGSTRDLQGNEIITGLIGNADPLYLQYRSGLLDSALVGVIDPCFGTKNWVDIGVGPLAKDYLIAISSPLRGDDDDTDIEDSCGQGRVILKEPGLNAAGLDEKGEPKSFTTTQEKIVAYPFSDDQYSMRITGTGIHPLLSQTAAAKSASFDKQSGALHLPKIRIDDELYEAELNIPASLVQNNTAALKFNIAYIDALPVTETPDAFQATYDAQNQQVIIPRVTDLKTGKAYTVTLRYKPGIDAYEDSLEVIQVQPIE